LSQLSFFSALWYRTRCKIMKTFWGTGAREKFWRENEHQIDKSEFQQILLWMGAKLEMNHCLRSKMIQKMGVCIFAKWAMCIVVTIVQIYLIMVLVKHG
jgi:hypothetical protein